MRLLLINNNPAVSKLINLSAEKLGYEIEEISNDSVDLEKSFDITITDSDSVEENSFLLLKESGNLGKIVFIGSKGVEKPEFADYFLQKPFLPTDFVDLLKKIDKTVYPDSDNISEEDFKYENKDEVFHDRDDDYLNELNLKNLQADEALELDDLDILAPTDSDLLKLESSDDFIQEKDDDGELTINEFEEDDPKEQESSDDVLQDDALSITETEDNEDDMINTSILDSEEVNQVKELLEEEEESDENVINESENDLRFVADHEEVDEPEDILEEKDQEEKDQEKEEEAIPRESLAKNSIDDLSEDDLAGIFEEDIFGKEAAGKKEELDLDGIKEDLQASIREDMKKALDKKEIKDALKGLKINISISFDEI